MSDSTSGVGYYIKNPKDSQYAIVFADRLVQAGKTVKWSSSNSSSCAFPSLTTEEKAKFKTYVISDEEYTDSKFGTNKVIKVADGNIGNEERFMAMSLSDISSSYYNWYYSAYSWGISTLVTETGFDMGKMNTSTMVTKWNASAYGRGNGNSNVFNRYKDVWDVVREEQSNGWFLPSKDEWSAFGVTFGGKSYTDLGLKTHYWTSSQESGQVAWYASANRREMAKTGINSEAYARLATNF